MTLLQNCNSKLFSCTVLLQDIYLQRLLKFLSNFAYISSSFFPKIVLIFLNFAHVLLLVLILIVLPKIFLTFSFKISEYISSNYFQNAEKIAPNILPDHCYPHPGEGKPQILEIFQQSKICKIIPKSP